MSPSSIAHCAAIWLALFGSTYAQSQGPAPGRQPAPVRTSPPAAQQAEKTPAQRPVQPAAHQEVLPEVAPLPGEQMYYEGEGPVFADDWGTCGPGGCNFCGQRGPGCGPFGQGCLSGVYVRAEYLLWGAKGATLPPLVTSSPPGTAQNVAGILGEPDTVILFGDETVNNDLRSGGRLVLGWWFDPCRRLGIEGDYFSLDDESTDFRASSTGTTIIGVPFYDVVQGIENVNLVAFPNLIQGTIAADYRTTFQGAGIRAMYNLACGEGGGCSWITGCPVHTGFRFDMLLGYRFVRLDDNFTLVENSVSLSTANPGSFNIRDQFDTENQFHGIDLGTSLSFCKGCFSLEMLSKIALGNTHSVTTINGSTIITQNGISETFPGGIFAQRTNSGTFEDDQFAVVPELGVMAGYQINPCWRVTVGYTFIYWSQVARAGDQIDREL
ncbi:MAG TPA: BBP7 family outer membrane beta-barrel protein, partial [Pirellulaceae bacterium]|nr:BBP7 family outer membrane beta-barrel protein [Pirellulaceae bacterium]